MLHHNTKRPRQIRDRFQTLRKKQQRLMFIEMLESRDLLARVAWDGEAGNALWSNPLNWDGNALPIAGDSVVINAPGNVQVVYDLDHDLQLSELHLSDNLQLINGSIQVSGAFSLQNGNTLISDNAEFYATGTSNINSANLRALNGGLIQLEQLSAYANENKDDSLRYISAVGVGSRINLPKLSTLSSVIDPWDELRIEALLGGRVEIGTMATTTQVTGGTVLVTADGGSSMLTSKVDIPKLSLFRGNPWDSTPGFFASRGGEIAFGNSEFINATLFLSSSGKLVGNAELLSGSRLQGSGVFYGSIENSGVVFADRSLRITGDYSQSVTGELQTHINGLQGGSDSSLLVVDGKASVDGVLRIIRPGNFNPSLGQQITVLSSDDLSGTFNAIFGQSFSSGTKLTPRYDENTVKLLSIIDAGPRVSTILNSKPIRAFSFLDVQFDESVQSSSFTQDDVFFSGPGGFIDILSIETIDNDRYRIHFPLQFSAGTYSLTIGPSLNDVAGSIGMDQNSNGINGESADSFSTIIVAEIPPPKPIPSIPGDGARVFIYNGIGGGTTPTPSALIGKTPSGSTLTPIFDFPNPGAVINVGNNFLSFFANTTTPPDALLDIPASNFILESDFFLAIPKSADLNPGTPEIEIRIGVGSDDGFYLEIDDRFLGSAGDRGFSYSWMDFVVGSEGLYPVQLLYAANQVGQSGLELAWTTASGTALIPQASMYFDDLMGQQLITFEDLAIGSTPSNEFMGQGLKISVLGGSVQVTDTEPDKFVPISRHNVLADPNTNSSETGIVEFSFVVPGSQNPATTNFFGLFLIDTESIGGVVTAYNPEGQVLFSKTYNMGGASQEPVRISADRIAKVRVELGKGTDRAAIDNITFNTPVRLNNSPIVGDIQNQTIAEGQRLSFLVNATDPEQPQQSLRFLLVKAPAGASIDLNSGRFSWVPSEAQGPDNHEIIVRVIDTGIPAAFTDKSFWVNVTEVNSSPSVLSGQGIDITPNATKIANLIALDSDIPSQTLTWEIQGAIPEGIQAVLTSPAGVLQITTTGAISEGDYPITVKVRDNGTPNFSATGLFNVRVDRTPPRVTSVSPLNSILDPLSAVVVIFSEAVTDTALVTSAYSIDGPAGVYTITQISRISERAVVLHFAPTTDIGLFVITARPLIEDLAGNRFSSNQTFSFARQRTLGLRAAQNTLIEGGDKVLFTLHRNGPLSTPLDVAITSSLSNAFVFPATVTIPAGSSSATFEVEATADGELSENRLVTFTATNSLFQQGVTQIALQEGQVPSLLLQMPNQIYSEGNSFEIVVSRSISLQQPSLVTLVSTLSGQLSLPSTVTIPAGQTEVRVQVQVIDDTVTETAKSLTIVATSPLHRSAQVNVQLNENDIPEIELIVPSGSLRENSFNNNLEIVRRTISSNPIYLQLFSNQSNRISIPSTVILPGNTPRLTVPVSVFNDNNAQSSTSVTFVARILDPQTGAPTTAAPIEVTTPLNDDDSPALTIELSRDVIAEGSTIEMIIRRNSNPTSPLTVQLAPSSTGVLLISPTATIPAGLSSVTLPVAAFLDGINTGTRLISISAQAPGHTESLVNLAITDMDQPDLTLDWVEIPASAAAGSRLQVQYALRNDGLVPASAGSMQQIYLESATSGDRIFLHQVTLKESIPVGKELITTATVTMPRIVGNYRFIVIADVMDSVKEVIESNNLLRADLLTELIAAYSVTANVDVTSANMGTPIQIRGVARLIGSESPAANQEVNVHIEVNGVRRILSAVTNTNGEYSTLFRPLPTEIGEYKVGATHPASSAVTHQDSFYLVGLDIQRSVQPLTVEEGVRSFFPFHIRNPLPINCNELTVEIISQPSNLQVTPRLSSVNIPGNSSVLMDLEILATDATILDGTVRLRFRTNQTNPVDIDYPVRVKALRSILEITNADVLKTTIVRDRQTILPLTISNRGGAAVENLSINLPANGGWIKQVQTISSNIPAGKSVTLELLLNPTSPLELTTYSGDIVLNSADSSLRVPFSFRLVSEVLADLTVRVVDEYFYFSSEKPLVESATVRLLDPQTSLPIDGITSKVTDASGTISFDSIPEGFYTLEVSSPKHETVRSTIKLRPGSDQVETVFASRQAVKYTWNVEEIEIEDRTQIVLESTFETNVPMPVVVVDGVFDLSLVRTVGQTMQVMVKVTNHGLIAAHDIRLNFSPHPYYKFEALVDSITTLPAKTELVIPVTVTRVADSGSLGGEGEGDSIPCSIEANAIYFYFCGKLIAKFAPLPVTNVDGNCSVPPLISAPGSYSGGFAGVGGGTVPSTISSTPIEVSVDPCDCLPKKYELSYSGGPLKVVADKMKGALRKVVPFLEDAEADVSVTGTLKKCCEDGEDKGWEFTASGEASISAKGILPFAGAGFAVSTPGYQVMLLGVAGVEITVDAKLALSGGTDCGFTDLVACGSLSASVKAFGGLIGKASVTHNGTEYEGTFKLGVEGGLEGFLTYCTDNGWSGDLCLDDINLIGSVEVSIGGNQVELAISQTIFEKRCYFGTDGGEGPLDTEYSYLMSSEDAVAMLGYPNLNALNQALNLSLGPNQSLDTTMMTTVLNRQYQYEQPPGSGVCAQVRLQIEQSFVQTRQGFKAGLTLQNGSSSPLDHVGVSLQIRDVTGKDVTELFVIRPPVLSGFDRIDGTGILDTNRDGMANWIIIPTLDAAKERTTEYRVGGTVRYRDAGHEIQINLYPTPIYVTPQPELSLVYFQQRDVIGDDPFTDEVEESQPFDLALMISNTGRGVARNVQIESSQPKIVENEKGLLVDFQILEAYVDGKISPLSLTVPIGNIAPESRRIINWKMLSTLQGLFVDYEASFSHSDNSGNKRLSLIQDVEIKELIRTVQADGRGGASADTITDFLTNDFSDPLDLPDTLYTSDGKVVAVEPGIAPAVGSPPSVANQLQSMVSVSMPAQWGYVRMPDPSNGDYELVAILRGDGTAIPAANLWQTFKTFVGNGRTPIEEPMIHWIDYAGTSTYTLIYAGEDRLGPTVTQFSSVPNPATSPLNQVVVTFNEPILASSFTVEDMNFFVNGTQANALTGITIGQINPRAYRISGLSTLSAADAVYELAIDTKGIQDLYGNIGSITQSLTWVKGETAPAIISLSGSPADNFTTATLDDLEILFTEAIDRSLLVNTLTLKLDGASQSLSSLSVDEIGTGHYRIGGFTSFTTPTGTYELTIDSSMVRDLDQNLPGIGRRTLTWTRDVTSPNIQSLRLLGNDVRNAPAQIIYVDFSEPLASSGFASDSLSLVLNQTGTNLIANDARVIVKERTPTRYEISGITWPQAMEGQYTFTIDATAIVDRAGNRGNTNKSLSWKIDLSPPKLLTNLQWESEAGTPIGAKTNLTRAFIVGSLDEPSRIVLSQRDDGERLLVQNIPAGGFRIPVDLTFAGLYELELSFFDLAGNRTRIVAPSITVDRISTFVLNPINQANQPLNFIPSDPIIQLSRSITPLNFDSSKVLVYRNGELRPPTTSFSLAPITGTPVADYRLLGLSSAIVSDGLWKIVVSADALPGIENEFVYEFTLDRVSPQLHNVSFSTLVSPVTTAVWKVSFTGFVNLPELHSQRTGQFVVSATYEGMDTDREASTTIPLNTEQVQIVYDSAANLTSFRLLIPNAEDGIYKIRLNRDLIQDEAGNRLGGSDGNSVIDFIFHRLAGDANGDRFITSADMAATRAALGSNSSQPNWIYDADVDRNGFVNDDDLRAINERIGRRVQPADAIVPLMQNRVFIHDVNDDEFLTAIDALVIINFLNRYGPRQDELATFNIANANYLDVSGDRIVNAIDALQVINRLNRSSFLPGGGEGEAEPNGFYGKAADSFFRDYPESLFLAYLSSLEYDSESDRKRLRK